VHDTDSTISSHNTKGCVKIYSWPCNTLLLRAKQPPLLQHTSPAPPPACVQQAHRYRCSSCSLRHLLPPHYSSWPFRALVEVIRNQKQQPVNKLATTNSSHCQPTLQTTLRASDWTDSDPICQIEAASSCGRLAQQPLHVEQQQAPTPCTTTTAQQQQHSPRSQPSTCRSCRVYRSPQAAV
jgi:hypothetical protein